MSRIERKQPDERIVALKKASVARALQALSQAVADGTLRRIPLPHGHPGAVKRELRPVG